MVVFAEGRDGVVVGAVVPVSVGRDTRRGSVRGVRPKRRETGARTELSPHRRGAGVSGSVASLMGDSAVEV